MATTKQLPLVSGEAAAAAEAEAKAREQALADMSPALRAVYLAEREYYAAEAAGGLAGCWHRGRVVQDLVRGEVPGTGRVEDNAVELLAAALGVAASQLYKRKTFCDMMSLVDVDRLCARVKSEDYRFGWGHMAEVVHVPECRQGADPHRLRREVIDVAVARRLTVRALRLEVGARFPAGRAGDEDAPAKAVGRLLKQIEDAAVKALSQLDVRAEATVIGLGKINPGDASPTLMNKLSRARTGLIDLNARLADAARRFETEQSRLREKEQPKGSARDRKVGAA